MSTRVGLRKGFEVPVEPHGSLGGPQEPPGVIKSPKPNTYNSKGRCQDRLKLFPELLEYTPELSLKGSKTERGFRV